nr:MAG TPA: hypothetical protein [Caudoviricetes sp.]
MYYHKHPISLQYNSLEKFLHWHKHYLTNHKNSHKFLID